MSETVTPVVSAVLSPWKTVREAAEYARVKPQTVRNACLEYERTEGQNGLRNYQRSSRGARILHVADIDRWIRGERPADQENA